MPDPVRFERPGNDEDLPVVVVVQEADGAWTPGPCVSIESGSVIELTPSEFEWLVSDVGQAALKALRDLAPEGPC